MVPSRNDSLILKNEVFVVVTRRWIYLTDLRHDLANWLLTKQLVGETTGYHNFKSQVVWFHSLVLVFGKGKAYDILSCLVWENFSIY